MAQPEDQALDGDWAAALAEQSSGAVGMFKAGKQYAHRAPAQDGFDKFFLSLRIVVGDANNRLEAGTLQNRICPRQYFGHDGIAD